MTFFIKNGPHQVDIDTRRDFRQIKVQFQVNQQTDRQTSHSLLFDCSVYCKATVLMHCRSVRSTVKCPRARDFGTPAKEPYTILGPAHTEATPHASWRLVLLWPATVVSTPQRQCPRDSRSAMQMKLDLQPHTYYPGPFPSA